MSELRRVEYRVTGEVVRSGAVIARRGPVVTERGTWITTVDLTHARSRGIEDEEAMRRIIAIAHREGYIEPSQVELVTVEEV